MFLIRDAGIVSYHIDSPKKVVIEINFGKDKLLRMKDEEKNEKGKEGKDDEHLWATTMIGTKERTTDGMR